MSKVISVINYKGGVGKTTITLELGLGLAVLQKKKVLLVDLDPQCSLSLSTVEEEFWVEWVDRKGSVRDVIQTFYTEEKPKIEKDWIIENALDRSWDRLPGPSAPTVDLLPSHLDLPEYEMKLVSKKPGRIKTMEEYYLERLLVLKEAIASVRKKYDVILFDCPPNIYLVSRNAIVASDYYLMPTIPDFISCYGIPFILRHIENMKEEVRAHGKRANASFLGIVRNRVRKSGAHMVHEHEQQSRKLKEEYEDYLYSAMVMDRIGVAELLGLRKNIFGDKEAKFADVREDFTGVVKETVRRMAGF